MKRDVNTKKEFESVEMEEDLEIPMPSCLSMDNDITVSGISTSPFNIDDKSK